MGIQGRKVTFLFHICIEGRILFPLPSQFSNESKLEFFFSLSFQEKRRLSQVDNRSLCSKIAFIPPVLVSLLLSFAQSPQFPRFLLSFCTLSPSLTPGRLHRILMHFFHFHSFQNTSTHISTCRLSFSYVCFQMLKKNTFWRPKNHAQIHQLHHNV